MKKKFLFFITACFLSVSTWAQTPETEPNNSSTAAGVQTITADGSFSGYFNSSDLEYYRIAPNSGGTITVTYTDAPTGNGLWLAPYPSGSFLASAFNPGSFTYVLNPAQNYMLYTGTGSATGNWKFTITGLSTVSANIAGSNVLCYGGTSGAATVTASGDAPFTYSWMPAGGTASVATGLSAGIYSVLVTNATGVSVTETVSITQPVTALGTNTAITPPRCNSGFGSATVTASGGTGPYDYLWSNSQIGSDAVFLYAGNYTVTVSDANSCSVTTTVTVTEPGPISYTFAPDGIPCHGGTGTASVNASGGSGSFTYLWSTGAITPTVSNLPPGTHSVTVTDTYSCSATMSAIYTDPPALTTATTAVNATCINPGSATVTASGGTPIYTYSWSSGATTQVASLNPGTYTVTVKDVNACTSSQTVTILPSPALTLTATASSASVCAGRTTTLTANSSGGTGAITYTWASGFNATTYTVAPATNTTYTVNASDSNGCTASSTIAITAGTLPTLTVNSATICSGNSHTIVPSGAVTYTITGNTYTVTPAATTSYSVTGTGSNGCAASNTAVATVSVNTTPTIAVNNATICSGTSATLVPTGAAAYTITGTTFTVMPSVTTSYSVTGSSNGCRSSNTVVATVSVNASPTLAVNSATICSGMQATIIPTGATTYSITGNTFTVSPGTTTSYSVTGTGTNGCLSSNTAVATISVNTTPTVSVSSATICSGMQATLIPGGAVTYTISGGNFTVSPSTTTSYSITGTDNTGCESSVITATVTVNPTPTLTVNSATICSGSSALLVPSGANTYTISGGSFTVSPATTTSYSVTGSSTAGCISSGITATVTVNALPAVTASSSGATLCVGESATLTATGAATYSWSSSQTAPEIVVSSSLAVSQTYTVSGTDANGCVNTATVLQVSDLCTGLAKVLNADLSVSLFPNPSNGLITVKFEFDGRKALKVFDGTGRMVQSLVTDQPEQVLDLSGQAKGMYSVQLSMGGSIKTFRVLVQ